MIHIKNRLDQIGPGFCLAKYTDLSLHLESGHAHSCVHPGTHKIPAEEVEKDPGTLHNSSHKISVRQQALEGKRPDECSYCWNMESSGENVISDRTYFSSPYVELIDTIIEKGPGHQHYPRRLEISFSTTCNFKCAYCSPDVSSMWARDIERNGPITTFFGPISLEYVKEKQKIPISDREYNPYIEAFWKWFPEAYQHLDSFRVTGGEPLLNHNTFKVIEWIKTNPKADLQFGINTNLGVPDTIISRFIEQLEEIDSQRSVKSMTVWTSGESAGLANNYTRFGGDYTRWLENIDLVLSSSRRTKIRIMTTYNILSVTTYNQFLDDIAILKRKHPGRIILDTHTYLQFPRFLTIDILTPDFQVLIDEQVEKVRAILKSGLGSEHEVFMAERLQKYFKDRMSNQFPELNTLRKDFYHFITEFDIRSGTRFLETFPDMKDFFKLCEDIYYG